LSGFWILTLSHGNGCCDFEKRVKVKGLILQRGRSKHNHLAYWKGSCCKKPLNYKQILFPLKYIGKVNFALKYEPSRSLWPSSRMSERWSPMLSTVHIVTMHLSQFRFVKPKHVKTNVFQWQDILASGDLSLRSQWPVSMQVGRPKEGK